MTLSGFQTQRSYERCREHESTKAHNLHLIREYCYSDNDSLQLVKKFLSRPAPGHELCAFFRQVYHVEIIQP